MSEWRFVDALARAKQWPEGSTRTSPVTDAAVDDRARLIELVKRLKDALDATVHHAHLADGNGEDRCDDDCPGCEAEELLRELED